MIILFDWISIRSIHLLLYEPVYLSHHSPWSVISEIGKRIFAILNENWRDSYVGALIMPYDSPMAISHEAQPDPKTVSPPPRKMFALSEEAHGI